VTGSFLDLDRYGNANIPGEAFYTARPEPSHMDTGTLPRAAGNRRNSNSVPARFLRAAFGYRLAGRNGLEQRVVDKE
jgi:hypothetical protein